jgi:hypothetical protein
MASRAWIKDSSRTPAKGHTAFRHLLSNDCRDRFDAELLAGPPALLSVENAEGIMLKPDEDRFQLAVAFYAVDGIFNAFGSENGPKIGAYPAELYLAWILFHRFSL